MVKQIKDNAGSIVPLLSYKLDGAHKLTYDTVTANSIIVSSKIVSITATSDCFIELGAVATTNSHYILGAIPYDFSIGAERSNATLSVIGSGASGTIYISERD
jgi:hypothetical protein